MYKFVTPGEGKENHVPVDNSSLLIFAAGFLKN